MQPMSRSNWSLPQLNAAMIFTSDNHLKLLCQWSVPFILCVHIIAVTRPLVPYKAIKVVIKLAYVCAYELDHEAIIYI
jgi:hypothetical protein